MTVSSAVKAEAQSRAAREGVPLSRVVDSYLRAAFGLDADNSRGPTLVLADEATPFDAECAAACARFRALRLEISPAAHLAKGRP